MNFGEILGEIYPPGRWFDTRASAEVPNCLGFRWRCFKEVSVYLVYYIDQCLYITRIYARIAHIEYICVWHCLTTLGFVELYDIQIGPHLESEQETYIANHTVRTPSNQAPHLEPPNLS